MKFHSITAVYLLLACASVIYAQNAACKNDTYPPVRSFRRFSGYLPDGCTNFTYVFKAEGKGDVMLAKFFSFNLTDMFDVVNIRTSSSSWIFTPTSTNTGDYMITTSSEIEIDLFSNSKRHDEFFELDLFAQDCGGTFTDKGSLSCNTTEDPPRSKVYQLIAPKNQQVVVRVNNLDDAENVKFYEGYNNNSAPFAVFTKTSPKYDIFSETNALLIIVNGSKPTSNFAATFHSNANHANFRGQESSGIWELVDAVPLLNYTWLVNPSGSDSDLIAFTINEFNAQANDTLVISDGLAYNPILSLSEPVTSQRSFYFPLKTGVRVDLFKAKVQTKNEISVTTAYTVTKDCNQMLETAPDSITSPGYSSQYFHNSKCQWSIANKFFQTYRVIMADFVISSSDNLTYDYDTKTTPVVSQMGDMVFNKSVTFNWSSLVNKSLLNETHRGFLLNFKTYDYGYPITVHKNAALKYSGANMHFKCFWTVDAPRQGDEVNNIQFTITTAVKSVADLPIVVYDGGNSSAKILPVTFKDGIFSGTSRTNKLMIEVLSAKAVPAFDVSLTENVCPKAQQCMTGGICMHPEWICDGKNDCGDWSDEKFCHFANTSCGGEQNRTLNATSSTDVTLDAATKFGGELNCYWKINTTSGSTLVAQFGTQVLNNSLEMITISDGEDPNTAVKIMELTSRSPNTQDYIITANHTLWVNYFNYYGSQKSNFTLSISTQAFGHRVNRAENTTIPSGLKNVTQMYEIEMNNDQQVAAMFKPNKTMLPDWTLTFYDGFSLHQLPLAVVKSDSINNPVVSTSNKMLVVTKNFHDISSGVLAIKPVPTGTNFVNQSDAGSLYLTQVKPAVYTWQIKPNPVKNDKPINGVINVKLSKLTLLGNDSLVLYRDDDREGKAIAQFNSSVTSAKVFHIPVDSGAFVKYNSTNVSSDDPDYAILSASYEVLPSCKQDIMLNNYEPQIVASPGYPNIYPINAACLWNVTVPKGKLIHVVFNDFNLNENHPLAVKSNTSTVLLAYNSTLPDDLLIVNGSVYIVWNSSRYDQRDNLGRGFSLSVRMLDCGGNFTLEKGNGNFSTPSGNTTVHCGWAANVPQYSKDKDEDNDKDKNLNILKFSVVPKTHPNLIIYNGGSSHSPIMGNISENELSLTNTVLFFYTYDQKKKSNVFESSINVTFTADVCNHTCNASHLCMHDAWICNGVNDCGDNSDEINCALPPTTPAPTPAPCEGCKAGWIVLSVIIGLIIGALLAIGIPILYKRFFGGAGNYQRFGEGES